MASMSAREFNQNVSLATRLAQEEPLFISRRGTVEYVLLSIEDYRELRGDKTTLLDALYMPEAASVSFEENIMPRRVEKRQSAFE